MERFEDAAPGSPWAGRGPVSRTTSSTCASASMRALITRCRDLGGTCSSASRPLNTQVEQHLLQLHRDRRAPAAMPRGTCVCRATWRAAASWRTRATTLATSSSSGTGASSGRLRRSSARMCSMIAPARWSSLRMSARMAAISAGSASPRSSIKLGGLGVAQDRAQRLVDLVRQGRGQLPGQADPGRAERLLAQALQFVLRPVAAR